MQFILSAVILYEQISINTEFLFLTSTFSLSEGLIFGRLVISFET